jgi:SAM-dependent methyltransferase
MSKLYTQLSKVYEAMYQTFMNYPEELSFYSGLLTKYHCRSVLEIGCGTGNLAAGFVSRGFNYTGLDYSEDMLQLANKKNSGASFIKRDMRDPFSEPTR